MKDIEQKLLAKFFHDIATPLNSIFLIFELFIEEEKNNKKKSPNLLAAKQSCETMVDIFILYKVLLYEIASEELIQKSVQIITKNFEKNFVNFGIFLPIPTLYIPEYIYKILTILFLIFHIYLKKDDSFSVDIKEDGRFAICIQSLNAANNLKPIFSTNCENESVAFSFLEFICEKNNLECAFENVADTCNFYFKKNKKNS